VLYGRLVAISMTLFQTEQIVVDSFGDFCLWDKCLYFLLSAHTRAALSSTALDKTRVEMRRDETLPSTHNSLFCLGAENDYVNSFSFSLSLPLTLSLSIYLFIVSVQVDVWSTGCVLLELLFGHRR
jgi:serine/threonine protein kinase